MLRSPAIPLFRHPGPDDQEDFTNHSGTVTGYELCSDGRAALERGDVADVVARRLPA